MEDDSMLAGDDGEEVEENQDEETEETSNDGEHWSIIPLLYIWCRSVDLKYIQISDPSLLDHSYRFS